MKELISNIFQTSNERIKNPFIGSFILSWIFFNWKILLTIMLSDLKIEGRIEYISSNFTSISNSLYNPLIFAGFYVLALPYIMWFIDYLILKAKKGRKKNLIEEKISDIIDKQKIAIEESKYENIKASYAEVSELNKKIEDLNTINGEKQKEIQNLKIQLIEIQQERDKLEQYITLEDPDKDSNEYTESEIKKLDDEFYEFSSTEAYTYLEDIGTEISQFKRLPNNTDRLVIEKYIYSGLIKQITDINNENRYYVLTRKGKYFWKRFVLTKKVLTKNEKLKMENEDLPF